MRWRWKNTYPMLKWDRASAFGRAQIQKKIKPVTVTDTATSQPFITLHQKIVEKLVCGCSSDNLVAVLCHIIWPDIHLHRRRLNDMTIIRRVPLYCMSIIVDLYCRGIYHTRNTVGEFIRYKS